MGFEYLVELISRIPEKAYEYVVNGRSAVEWVMERYRVRVDKDTGIKNDPNNWCDEVGDELYVLELLLRVINVSVRSVAIVEGVMEPDGNIQRR